MILFIQTKYITNNKLKVGELSEESGCDSERGLRARMRREIRIIWNVEQDSI